jgi:hypothetical protein
MWRHHDPLRLESSKPLPEGFAVGWHRRTYASFASPPLLLDCAITFSWIPCGTSA